MSLSRIFWPSAGIRRTEGKILGLRVEDVVVVVAIVEDWVSARRKGRLMSAGRPGTPVSQLNDCGISGNIDSIHFPYKRVPDGVEERFTGEIVVSLQD